MFYNIQCYCHDIYSDQKDCRSVLYHTRVPQGHPHPAYKVTITSRHASWLTSPVTVEWTHSWLSARIPKQKNLSNFSNVNTLYSALQFCPSEADNSPSWKTLHVLDADDWGGLNIFHAWNVTRSHDKLIIGNPMVSEGLDAHNKTGGESSTRTSRR